MVPQQSTQTDNPSTDWTRESDESVRITAEQRRQTLVAFLAEELARQQVVADFEAKELKSKRKRGVPSTHAERRAANATAVLQYIGSTLRAYGVRENRDFLEVTRRALLDGES